VQDLVSSRVRLGELGRSEPIHWRSHRVKGESRCSSVDAMRDVAMPLMTILAMVVMVEVAVVRMV